MKSLSNREFTEQIDSLKDKLEKQQKISAALLEQVKKQLDQNCNINALFDRTSYLQKNIAETSKKLRHQTNAFESLYQHSADGMLFIENGKFVECNDAIINILHCDSKDQVLQLHPAQISPEFQPDGRSSLEKANEMMQLARDNGSNQFQWLHQRVDGEEFWADIVLTSMTLNAKPLLHVSLRDISRLKQLEEEILKERDAANQANQAKSEFLSRMSHELRTPLNAILGFSQLLELDKTDFNKHQQENIHEILNAGIHLLELINEVLDLSRIESGSLKLMIYDVFLKEVLQECLHLISTQAEQRHIQLIDNVSHKGYCVQADAIRLKQALINLLSNAVKYNCEQGCITLDAELTVKQANKQCLRITITDTGRGLNQAEIKQLFKPFKRMNNNDNIEGTGIGLTITKNLIELMGGAIGVYSTPGQGSTFWIELLLCDN